MIAFHVLVVALLVVAFFAVADASDACDASGRTAPRPPAVPLVTHDPYFSVWSAADRLTDGWTRHWTGAQQALCGLARIDGQAVRFAGAGPEDVPAMEQIAMRVYATRTAYRFEAAGVALEVTFLSPLLPFDLDVLGRPVTYITLRASSVDGRKHDVQVYVDVTGEWVVDRSHQKVTWGRARFGDLVAARIGSAEQAVLNRCGDDLRVDWGYIYLAVPSGEGEVAMVPFDAARGGFAATGALSVSDDMEMPRRADDRCPVIAAACDLGAVGADGVSRHMMLAYDDIWSLELLNRRLRPYWRRDGSGPADLLQRSEREYAGLVERCRAFDTEVEADLVRVGGERYARLCALAFRQCLAAHKLAADFDGAPVHISKENFSNGCAATVDVTYPASPFFLLFNPDLLKAQVTSILDYAASSRWPWPFAPHDLGTYPLVNGQVYGGGERTEENQMPVEESGNMLIILAALAKADGSPDYALRYWPTIEKWAAYLRDKGMDPENQLCTDDFAGHLAHNVNLSAKAIVALGAFGQLCEVAGKQAQAAEYRGVALGMAHQWVERADDGDHYRLAFDRPGTWSQKYNLVWDRILGLGLFPDEVIFKELAYYRTQMRRYGLALDNRKGYTKTDWEIWTATMASDLAEFVAIADPVCDFADSTPSRVPLTDWYETDDARQVGFQARSVIGGIFVRMLADATCWRKWADRSRTGC